MLFILAIFKRWLEHRLKNRIVENGISESMAVSLLQTNPANNRNAPVKWFAMFTGLGAGLTIVQYTQPLGIHSLAIMAFSIAASFLGYAVFIRFTEK